MPPSPEVDAAWEALYSRSWEFYWNLLVVYILMIALRRWY